MQPFQTGFQNAREVRCRLDALRLQVWTGGWHPFRYVDHVLLGMARGIRRLRRRWVGHRSHYYMMLRTYPRESRFVNEAELEHIADGQVRLTPLS